MKRAKKHLDECEDNECEFCCVMDDLKCCCFGMRNNYGCVNEDVSVRQRCNELSEIVMNVSKVGIDKDGIDFINSRKNKVFDFVFEGHHYTASDSARDQSECPHCGYRNPSGLMFREDSPGVVFIGTKDFESHTTKCFECAKCYGKFYCHYVDE